MKKSIIALTLAIGIISLPGTAKASPLPTEKLISSNEQEWLQAILTSNPNLIAPLIAETFVSTPSSGKLTGKATELAYVKNSRWLSGKVEDLKITSYGNAAIATGAFRGEKVTDGKKTAHYLRWTDTWVKMPDGHWQCVATQRTPIKPRD